MQLILGTRNRKKGIELAELLSPWGFELLTLADVPNSIEIEETGTTFAENAALKACQ
ncbi:MAG TPA: non-canonical purine NTP pyrophosphatase, partial [Pirellulales bacterium]